MSAYRTRVGSQSMPQSGRAFGQSAGDVEQQGGLAEAGLPGQPVGVALKKVRAEQHRADSPGGCDIGQVNDALGEGLAPGQAGGAGRWKCITASGGRRHGFAVARGPGRGRRRGSRRRVPAGHRRRTGCRRSAGRTGRHCWKRHRTGRSRRSCRWRRGPARSCPAAARGSCPRAAPARCQPCRSSKAVIIAPGVVIIAGPQARRPPRRFWPGRIHHVARIGIRVEQAGDCQQDGALAGGDGRDRRRPPRRNW